MNKVFICILPMVLLLSPAKGHAQTGEEIRNHVIIAIDERVGNSNWKATDDDIRRKIETYLFKPIIVEGKTLYGGKPLYQNGDFLSIVSFSLSVHDYTIESFTSIAADRDGMPFKFVPYSEKVQRTIARQWDTLAEPRFIGSNRHSIFSLAVAHSMRACSRENDEQLTNRTFVLVITDRSYSDKDYFDDIRDFTDKQFDELGFHAIYKSNLLEPKQIISKDYFINWINQDETRYQFWTNHHERKKHVDLFEIQPLQEHLKMASIIRYPSSIVAKRGRWGHYYVDFSASPEDSVRFNVLRLDVRLKGKGIREKAMGYQTSRADSSFRQMAVSFDLGKERLDSVSLDLRVWANLKDGLYNATVLTPSQDGEAYLGMNGLNVSIPVVFEGKAKVLALFPLWDVFCVSGNQSADAAVVSVFLLLLIYYLSRRLIKATSVHEITADEINITYHIRDEK